MLKLQGPIVESFDNVNSEFEAIYKAQKKFGKALDKVNTSCLDFLELLSYI